MWCSEIFVWGRSSRGRLGLELNDETDVQLPTSVPALSHKGIHYLGKTAEVGSIAISKSGNEIYLWGQCAGSKLPIRINTEDLSSVPRDRAIHVSCGHDSLYLIVMSSGLVFYGTYHQRPLKAEDFINLNKDFLEKYLLPDELPLWSVGGQNSWSGVITNFSRLLAWQSYQYNSDSKCVIVPPTDNMGELFDIQKAFFGHRVFLALSTMGRLYRSDFSAYSLNTKPWILLSDPKHVVVDADGGSDHYGYVTSNGLVYTWGKGSMGCLGHGDKIAYIAPKKVKYFEENNMKVVAIGVGGTYSWDGGFTLFLLDDNRLFCSGSLGSIEENLLPVQITSDQLKNRHILSISSGEDWAGIVVSKSLGNKS
jgi:hypothetical protein